MERDWTVARLLATTTAYLARHGSSSARLDGELLLAKVLGVERVELYTQYDRLLTGDELAAFRELVRRRARHEPVAYILGRAHFRYLDLEVTPAVLIPRPETEELVDLAETRLDTHPLEVWRAAGVGADNGLLVCDVGTGSGAVALSLAYERAISVLGIDNSRAALEIARRNAEALGLQSLVTFREGDLVRDVDPASLALVVANPPYISDGEWSGLPQDVRGFEPGAALRGGKDGLSVYRRLLPQAAAALLPGGALIVEIGAEQGAEVADLAVAAGLRAPEVHRDMAGRDRFVLALRPGAPLLPLSQVDLEDDLRTAVWRALQAGGILGLPTDTVYGLACAWRNRAGLGALRQVKGRSEGKPFQVLFASVQAVMETIGDLSGPARAVVADLLPGPFTLVVATSHEASLGLGSPGSIGIRVPDDRELGVFLSAMGTPLAATSANLSGEPESRVAHEVPGELAAACSVLLTGQAAASARGTSSTVVDLRGLDNGGDAVVLREGAVPAAEVLARMQFLLS